MSDNLYFYSIPTRNISDKFTIIRDSGIFLQPGLISSSQETRFSYYQPRKIYKLIMGLIPNDLKYLLRSETSQKSLTFKYFLLQK